MTLNFILLKTEILITLKIQKKIDIRNILTKNHLFLTHQKNISFLFRIFVSEINQTIMIKHIVFFKFKASEDKKNRMLEIKEELEKLTNIIPELKEIHAGLNVNPAEKWDLALEAIVNDMHDLDIYANHPAHQRIVKNLIAPIKEDRAAVDFTFSY